MNKKLTLTIDDSIISFAHQYSKKTNQSISSIVERYFITLKKNEDPKREHTDITNQLYGLLSKRPLPDKAAMRREFHEKSID